MAHLYNVDAGELMKRAGREEHIDPFSEEAMDVDRAYPVRPGRPSLPRGHTARRPHHPEDQAVHRRDVRALHRKEAPGMNGTREDFCRTLLDDHPREALDPETLAARFVRYFDVPARPTMEELKALLKQAGFGEVSGNRIHGREGHPLQRAGGRLRHPLPGGPVGGDAGLLGDT